MIEIGTPATSILTGELVTTEACMISWFEEERINDLQTQEYQS